MRYHGKDAVVYISTSASGAASAVCLSKWTWSGQQDRVDTTAFCDSNKTSVLGLPDYSGTLSGFWDDTDTRFFAARRSVDGIKMYLYPSKNAPTKYFAGPAWLDASMDVDVNGAITISGNWVANGSWTDTF